MSDDDVKTPEPTEPHRCTPRTCPLARIVPNTAGPFFEEPCLSHDADITPSQFYESTEMADGGERKS